jgi:hypothetical protein
VLTTRGMVIIVIVHESRIDLAGHFASHAVDLADDFSSLTCQLRQFVWAKQHQHEKHNNEKFTGSRHL